MPAGIRAFDRDTANLRQPLRSSRYVGVIRGRPLGDPLGPMLDPATPRADVGLPGPGFGSSGPPRTLEAVWPLRLALTDTMPQVVRLDDDPAHAGGSDSITVGRAAPGATYNWFFPTGTRSIADRRQNSDVRLRLSADTWAWVSLADVQALPPGTWPPLGRVGSLTATVAVRSASPCGSRLELAYRSTRSETDRAV